MDPGSVKLVCFDIGGVILRICRSWAEGCAAAGIEVRRPELWDAVGPARRALIIEYQTGRLGGRTFASAASALVGGLYSPAEILGVHHAWLLRQYDGIEAIVDELHRAGVETATLSNTNHEHWVRMSEFPAILRIRHHLPSHRLGMHKPDPRIYRRVEQRLGFAGGEVLFLDDTDENVEAARIVGWRAEQIDPDRATADQIATHLRAHDVLG